MIWAFVFSLAEFILVYYEHDGAFFEAIKQSPVSFLMCIFIFFMIWSPAALSAFHCYIACQNLTTNDTIKRKREKNPYSHGPLTNFIGNFCAPFYVSYINFRAVIVPARASSEQPLLEDV